MLKRVFKRGGAYRMKMMGWLRGAKPLFYSFPPDAIGRDKGGEVYI